MAKTYNFSIKADATLSAASIKNIQSQLNQIGKQSGVKIDFSGGVNKTTDALKKATKQSGLFGQSFLDIEKKILGWTVATKVLFGVINGIRDGIQVIIDLDKALVNLQMATGKTYEETQKLIRSYNEMAQQLGSTTGEIAISADTWLRQGKSIAETNTLIKDSLILSKLAMLDSATATQYLTAITKGYKIATQDTLGVVDKLSAVDLEAAVSAGGISEALSRTSNIAQITGVSLDKLISYVTVVGEVTQKSMDSVGEGFKTIFTRMQNVKLGKWLDEEGEDISNVEQVLSSLNIKLRDSEDSFRNFGDVLDDVGGNWNSYSEVQQSAIASAFAGTRQAENFIALMENYSSSLKYAETAANSAGTALDKFGNYQNSVEAKSKELTATLEKLVLNTINGDFIKSLIDAGTGIVKLIDNLGVFNIAITAIVTAFIKLKGLEIAKWFSTFSGQIYAAGGGLKGFGSALRGLGESLKGIGITAAIAAVTFVITSFISKVSEGVAAFEKFRRELKETATNYTENKDKLNGLLTSLNGVTENSEEYFKITNQINGIMPSLISNIDEQGNAHLKTADAIKTEIERQEKLNDLYNKNKSTFTYSELNDKIKGFSEEWSPTIFGGGWEGLFGGATGEENSAMIASLQANAEVAAQEMADSFADSLNSKLPKEMQDAGIGQTIANSYKDQFAKAMVGESFRDAFSFLGFDNNAVNSMVEKLGYGEVDLVSINKEAFATINDLSNGTLTYNDVLTKLGATQQTSTNNANEQATAFRNLSDTISDSKFRSEIEGYLDVLHDWRSSNSDVDDSLRGLADALGMTVGEVTDNLSIITAYVDGDREAFENAFYAQLQLFGIKPNTGGIVSALNTVATAANNGVAQVMPLVQLLSSLGMLSQRTIEVPKFDKDGNVYDYAKVMVWYVPKSNISLPKGGGGGGGGGHKSSSSSDDVSNYLKGLKALLDSKNDIIDIEIDKQKDVLDTLKEQYKVEDMIYELQQAQLKLDNTQKEKNVRLYNPETGKFEWVADPRQVREAQKAYDDAQKEYQRFQAEDAIENQIDALEHQKGAISTVIDAINNVIQRGIGMQIKSWDQLIAKLDQLGIAYEDIAGSVDVSKASPVISSSARVSSLMDTLRKGDEGSDVKKLQRALSSLGYYGGKITGSFDSRTQSSLKAFQRKYGITESGILDTVTKKQFGIQGYAKGGLNAYTGLAMMHGTPTRPEYVQSAPAVESMMGSLPAILANLATDGNGNIYINIDKLMPNGFDNFVRDMKNQAALSSRVPRR
jgi:TP901 family phage tail tape measure protein